MKSGALLLVLGGWSSAPAADVSVPGGILRVARDAAVSISNAQVELTRGTITYHVQDPGAGQVEILTPSVSARAFEEGVYRVVIRKTGESEIIAQSGSMVVMAPGGEQWLETGQKMIARGPRANPEFRIVSAIAWWRRLAGFLENIQISGGGGASVESGGGSEQSGAARESHSKPKSESAVVPPRDAHSGADRPKTSDGHSNPASAGPHSGDSRPPSSGGGGSSHSSSSHAAPASTPNGGGGNSSHSAPSHAAPSGTSHASDNAPKGK